MCNVFLFGNYLFSEGEFLVISLLFSCNFDKIMGKVFIGVRLMVENDQLKIWQDELVKIINDLNTPHTLGGITNPANRKHDSILARRALDNLIILSEEINTARHSNDE
jgi:hypothetical protein